MGHFPPPLSVCWMLTVVVGSSVLTLSFSLISEAVGSTRSACSRWVMWAPSMKKSSSRNMMSTIGIRLQETLSCTTIALRFLDMDGSFPSSGDGLLARRQVPQHVDRLQVDGQAHLRDLVLEQEVDGQEQDRDEEPHGRVHQRLVHALRQVTRRRRL